MTGTGDGGETSLWSGERVPKTDARIAAVGQVDLALAALGVALGHLPAAGLGAEVRAGLLALQRRASVLMGELATATAAQDRFRARHGALGVEDVAAVEALYGRVRAVLDEAGGERRRGWRIYGEGGPAAAAFYFARGLVRQAELAVWALPAAGHPVRPELPRWLNKLSDLLFTVAVWLEVPEPSAPVGEAPLNH